MGASFLIFQVKELAPMGRSYGLLIAPASRRRPESLRR
jgi:hypothetical protein